MADFSPPESDAAIFFAETNTSWGASRRSSGEKSAPRTADFARSGETGTGHTTGSTAGATGGTDAGVWMPSKIEASTPLGAGAGGAAAPSGRAATGGNAGGVSSKSSAGTIGG